MIDDMGIFRTAMDVAHVSRPDLRKSLSDVMVDTGSVPAGPVPVAAAA